MTANRRANPPLDDLDMMGVAEVAAMFQRFLNSATSEAPNPPYVVTSRGGGWLHVTGENEAAFTMRTTKAVYRLRSARRKGWRDANEA